MQIQQEVLDRVVLDALSAVLEDRLIEAAVERALTQLRSEQAVHPDRQLAIERELSLIEARERHLVEAPSPTGTRWSPSWLP